MRSAVVIGGGLSGMLSAELLARLFDSVTVAERRDLEDGSEVPQSGHLHVLLQRGRLALERILPGIDGQLAAFGCPEIDWARDTLWFGKYGAFPRYESEVRTRSGSRGGKAWTPRSVTPAASFDFGARRSGPFARSISRCALPGACAAAS